MSPKRPERASRLWPEERGPRQSLEFPVFGETERPRWVQFTSQRGEGYIERIPKNPPSRGQLQRNEVPAGTTLKLLRGNDPRIMHTPPARAGSLEVFLIVGKKEP